MVRVNLSPGFPSILAAAFDDSVDTTLINALSAVSSSREAVVTAEAFNAVVRQYQRKVYRVVLLLAKDRDLADTLTQECFLRAYQSRESFRGECRIDTWLLRIAVNLVRDHARNRKMGFWKRLVGLDDSSEKGNEAESRWPSPERLLLARAELRAVWESVDRLSRQQRAIFLLRFVEEMELNEIAAVLGLKVGSVKAHLFRALTHVRAEMKEQKWR
jgi:RNA polymerase sigma-70 factor (ECF subfamily)